MVHSIDKASKGIWKCYIGSIPILGVSVVQVHMSDLQQTRLATEKQNYDCLFVVIINRRVERIRRYALIIFRRR